MARWLFVGMLAFSTLLASPASADIYRWRMKWRGPLHRRPLGRSREIQGKALEIQKHRPKPGGRPFPRWAPPPRAGPPPPPAVGGESPDLPAIPEDDDAMAAEKLRAKIAAKEEFLRGVDEKQSLATNRTGTASSPPRTWSCTRSTRRSSPPTGSN